MQILELLPMLDGVKRTGDNQWMAMCPCHDDRIQSLSVGIGKDGRILIHDMAGCDTTNILARLGLKTSDLYPAKENDRRTLEDTFTYPNGKMRKRKWRHADGTKDFDWQHKDKSGNWIKGRGGPAKMYYHLDDIKAQQGLETEMVFLMEGEKDVDTAHRLGIPAVSTPDGAAVKEPWKDSYSRAFEGKYVFIIPDNDQPGHDFAEKMAKHIKPIAKSLKVLDLRKIWPDCPAKGDFSDYTNAIGLEPACEKILNELIPKTSEWTESEPSPEASSEATDTGPKVEPVKLECISAKDLMALDILDPTYLVEDMLPDVGAVLLAGASKIGKSWMALQLALCVAMGIPFLDHQSTKAAVLYLALEDSMRTIRPRIRKQMKALNISEVPDNFTLCFESPNMDHDGLTAIANALKEYPETRLVIVDVLAIFRSYRGGSSLNAYEKDYKILRELKEFADTHNVAFLLITHTNKLSDASDRFNQISGSNGQMGVSDASWILYKNNRDDIDAQLDITGRAVRGNNYTVRFDNEDCIWQFRGESSGLLDQLDREAYEQSPLIQTVKLLLQDPPHRWQGLSSDLLDAGKLRINTAIAISSRDVGKKLREIKADLLRYDGIVYEYDKAGRRKFYYQASDGLELEELDDDDPDNVETLFDDGGCV